MKVRPVNRFLIGLLALCAAGITTNLRADAQAAFPESVWQKQSETLREGITVDLSDLKHGEIRRVLFGEITVAAYRRSPQSVASLAPLTEAEVAQNLEQHIEAIFEYTFTTSQLFFARVYEAGAELLTTRPGQSMHPEYFVFVGGSPFFGCAINIEKTSDERVLFVDPCEGAYWDESGLPAGARSGSPRSSHKNPLRLVPYTIKDRTLRLGGPATPDPLPNTHQKIVASHIKGITAPIPQLIAGVRWNRPEMVRKALTAQANPKSRVRYGKNTISLLELAVMNSHIDIIEQLLDAGASPNAKSFDIASVRKRSQVVALFCSRGFSAPDEITTFAFDPMPESILCPEA
ncbi:MAG: hypothetical protein AAF578_06850 [Pseudomonadota bacterium]